MEVVKTGADFDGRESTDELVRLLGVWIEAQRVAPFVVGDIVNELIERHGDNAYQLFPNCDKLLLWANVARAIERDVRNPGKSFTAHEKALKGRPDFETLCNRIWGAK